MRIEQHNLLRIIQFCHACYHTGLLLSHLRLLSLPGGIETTEYLLSLWITVQVDDLYKKYLNVGCNNSHTKKENSLTFGVNMKIKKTVANTIIPPLNTAAMTLM